MVTGATKASLSHTYDIIEVYGIYASYKVCFLHIFVLILVRHYTVLQYKANDWHLFFYKQCYVHLDEMEWKKKVSPH